MTWYKSVTLIVINYIKTEIETSLIKLDFFLYWTINIKQQLVSWMIWG